MGRGGHPPTLAQETRARHSLRTHRFSAVSARRFLGAEASSLLEELGRHHPYTERHSRQVAVLAGGLAQELNLDATQSDLVLRTALLHDVGKCAVPSRILNGTGQLSDEDWETLRGHSNAGAQAVEAVGCMHVVPAVRSVHERVDGGGYPLGLAGESIPLAARVVAVCDAYEAMISSERTYQKPRSRVEAAVLLTNAAGTQFDPRVVRAFLTLLDENAARDNGPDESLLLLSSAEPAARASARESS